MVIDKSRWALYVLPTTIDRIVPIEYLGGTGRRQEQEHVVFSFSFVVFVVDLHCVSDDPGIAESNVPAFDTSCKCIRLVEQKSFDRSLLGMGLQLLLLDRRLGQQPIGASWKHSAKGRPVQLPFFVSNQGSGSCTQCTIRAFRNGSAGAIVPYSFGLISSQQ